MDVDPLSVIFVKSDSKGDRLLFRYPYEVNKRQENGHQHRKKNPYALLMAEDLHGPPPQKFTTEKDYLANFADDILSNLFAVKHELCETKFELKVNDVRFVGHPTMVQPCSRGGKVANRSIILIHIVFALHATANHSIVKCYYELSKRFGVALRHEERRCGYVHQQIKTMIAAHDDFGSRSEDGAEGRNPFEVILDECSLARDLRTAYNHLKSSGLVELRINRWISLSFCLPQKVHQLHNRALVVEPEAIDKCLECIRPYHGILLLIEASQLLDSLAPDASPALIRLLKIYTPLKSIQSLSADADLTITQVFNLAGHLVYWGKAMFIYPLCETNVYMASPGAPVHARSPLVERFADQFPGQSLIQVMSEFSLPTCLREKLSPLSNSPHTDVQIIIWLLQQRLLVQLHTYIYYMSSPKGLPHQDGSSPEESVSSSDETGGEPTDPWSGQLSRDDCLRRLPAEERPALSAGGVENIRLLVRLILLDYLQGEHHIEEIMYTENLRRSQIMQLLDKFREVLVTCEAQDPALAIFYPESY